MAPWLPWSSRGGPTGQDAASRAAAEWRETVDGIDAPILVVDRGGRVLRLNATAQRLLGLEFPELLGRSVDSLATWEPWRTIAAVARQAGSGGAPLALHARGEHGKEWHVSASVVPGGSPDDRRVIVLARDVSAVVRLESSLRRVEAMAQLGTLVSGVAHEVRNPLFAILATVDALEARAGEREDLAPFTATLRGEVARLTRLMGDLLEYGRPPALELQDADIGDVVAAAVRALEPVAASRRVELRSEVPPRLARLRLDPVRIGQVVRNLAENALLLSPPGAPVVVSGALMGDGPDRRVEISVADRGPGFARADLEHVFEPFFTRRPGGTGLGLAIVRRLLSDHGGDVEARNRPGGGAEVCFSLPLASVDAPGPEPERAGAASSAAR